MSVLDYARLYIIDGIIELLYVLLTDFCRWYTRR